MQSQPIDTQLVVATLCLALGCPACDGRSGPLCDHGDICGVDASPDGTLIAVAGRQGRSRDGRLSVYDAQSGRELAAHVWLGDRLLCVAFDKGGRRLATCDSAARLVIWQITVSADAARGRLRPLSQLTVEAPGSRVAFSGDGLAVAVACRDHAVRVVDTIAMRLVKTLYGHKAGVTAVAFSPDGRCLASAGGTDGNAKIWDVGDWHLLLTVTYDSVDVTDVGFSVNGNRLIASYGKSFSRAGEPAGAMDYAEDHVRIWDAATGDLKGGFRIGGDRVTSLGLPPRNGLLVAGYTHERATTTDHAVAIVDTSSGNRQSTLRGTWRAPMARWCGTSHVVIVDGRFVSYWDVSSPADPRRVWGREWSWNDTLVREDGP